MSVATKEYTTGYKADTTIISVRANMDYDVEISAEGAPWLKAEKDKNSCKFYIAEYDGKAVRQATATFSSGKNVYKVKFTQIDVRGTYTATFSDYDENNELVGYKGTFELTENGLDIGGLVVPLTLNPTTGQITIYGGQYVGVYKTYFLYTSISSEEGYVTWNSATSYSGELTIDDDFVPSYTFGNDGSWTDYTIDGFTIDAYSAKTDPPVKANRLGTLLNFINLEMVKNTNTETPASLSKKRISKNAPTWNGRASHPRNLWKVKN